MPKWPDEFKDRMANIAAQGLRTPGYDFELNAPAVTEKDEVFEITWDIGDLRPGEWSDPRFITIIPGPNAPDELEVELVARAINRRRNKRSKETLTIASDQWRLDDWLDPEPRRERSPRHR